MSQIAHAEPPRNERLYTLLRRVQHGDILIPRFQRPFLWSDAQRLLLFDSIYRRLPIGSFIVWRTRSNELRCFDRIAGVPVQGRPAEASGGVLSYLLDGHQRLTTLYAALARGLLAEAQEDGQHVSPQLTLDELFGDDRPRELYFDLEEQNFELAPARGAVPPTWVALAIVFDRYALREWELRHLFKHRDSRRLINRLGELVERLKDYDVPVVTLASEDQSEATEAFSRVNSAGTPIGEVDLVGAAVWNDGIDLKQEIKEEVRRPLTDVGWQDLDERMMLNAVKAWLGLDIYRSDVGAIRKRISAAPRVFSETARNFKRATWLLARCGIRSPAVLPYSYQVVLLADALGRVGDPKEPTVVERLTRWLWATTYGEVFTGMNSSRLRVALAHVREVALGRADPIPDDVDRVVVPITRFDFRSARSRALIITMAEDWEPVRPDGKILRPLKVLAESGNAAAPMLFLSGTRAARGLDPDLLRGPENRFISRPTEANRLRRQLIDPATWRERVAPYHGMNALVRAAWGVGGPNQMLRARRLLLLKAERRRVEALGLQYGPDPASAEGDPLT